MLGFKERFSVILFLRCSSIVNFYPIDVDSSSLKIRPGRTEGWKDWACHLSYTLVIFHAIYTTVRFIHVFLFIPEVPLHQLLIHGELTAAYIVMIYWYYVLFIENADEYTALVGITLTWSTTGGKF